MLVTRGGVTIVGPGLVVVKNRPNRPNRRVDEDEKGKINSKGCLRTDYDDLESNPV